MSLLKYKQQILPLGAGPTLDLIHGGYAPDGNVCVASKTETWNQVWHPVADASAVCTLLEGAQDAYISCGSFSKPNRKTSNLREQSSIWVDLDCYKCGFSGDPFRILAAIMAAVPLPQPTILASSGRGLYLWWSFDKPIGPEQLPAWSVLIEYFVKQLLPFGADRACTDPSRVLRVVGSVNSKNDTEVQAWPVGPTYKFKDLRKLIKPVLAASNKSSVEPSEKPKKPVPDQLAGKTWSKKVCDDLETLAGLRGGRFTDNRSRALFVYGAQAAWWTLDTDQLVARTQDFVDEFFADPEKYNASKRLTTVKHRKTNQDLDRIWNGQRVPNRYRMGAKKIIAWLDISEEEQRKLKVLISKGVKDDRRITALRLKGIQTRDQYLEPSRQRQAQAQDLFSQGLRLKEVAQELAVTPKTALKYHRNKSPLRYTERTLPKMSHFPTNNVWLLRLERIHQLQAQGLTVKAIAIELGVDRRTIQRAIKRGIS